MNDRLDVQWQTFIVVTPGSVAGLGNTLADIKAHSLRPQVELLASDVPALRHSLADSEHVVHFCLPAEIDPDYAWSTVIDAISPETVRALIVVAGVRLPDSWDARIVAAAQTIPQAAAVAPMGFREGAYSVFSHQVAAPRLTLDELDQWVNDYARGESFSVPCMPAACLLVQGDLFFRAAGPSVRDEEMLTTVRNLGGWLVATDQLVVDDGASAFAAQSDSPALQGFLAAHPLAQLRHALSELSARRERPADSRRCLPVQLHVGHSWGGGLDRWISSYVEADTAHNNLVLRSIGDTGAFGRKVALYGSARMDMPLRTWVLPAAITSTVVSMIEYRRLLLEIVEVFNVESLVVSSLIGHSLDVLQTGLPTTLVLHDFFPFCPALYATFDGACSHCSVTELTRCQVENKQNRYFMHESFQHWVALRHAFFDLLERREIHLIAPSQSVADRYGRLDARMAAHSISIIEHGLPDAQALAFQSARSKFDTRDVLAVDPARPRRLKIVVLGRLSVEKGSDLLSAILDELLTFADLFLLGAGSLEPEFHEREGLVVIPSYSLDDLPEKVAHIQPDLGLLLSVVPETFSYTLSELWALGIPVMATAHGAFLDRIAPEHNGWLVPPEAEALLATLKELAVNPASLASVTESVRAQPVHRATQMLEAYRQVQPRLEHIPSRRFFLPRRSHLNPYLQGGEVDQAGMFIERTRAAEATYRSVLREFLQYTAHKLDTTQRLPRWIKGLVIRVIGVLQRLVR